MSVSLHPSLLITMLHGMNVYSYLNVESPTEHHSSWILPQVNLNFKLPAFLSQVDWAQFLYLCSVAQHGNCAQALGPYLPYRCLTRALDRCQGGSNN